MKQRLFLTFILLFLASFSARGNSPSSTTTASASTTINTTSASFLTKQLEKEETPMSSTATIDYVFSDVDGTLVHYPDNIANEAAEEGNRIVKLPPSSTGMQGIISSASLAKCQEIRKLGKKLTIVSGMRSTTMLKRIPYLPRSDAYCCEAGGRIFYSVSAKTDGPVYTPVDYDGATSLAPFSLEEDPDWRKEMQKIVGVKGFIGNELNGNQQEEPVGVDSRDGLLWEFCRELQTEGFVCDTKGYSTCFRVNRKQQTTRSEDDFKELLKRDPPQGLATSVNLGCIDYYPAESGKKKW